MANDLAIAIPRSLYYDVASHKRYVLRTYNHEDMLIYSKISTLMSIFIAINNDLDSAAPKSSLQLIVLLLRHVCVWTLTL